MPTEGMEGHFSRLLDERSGLPQEFFDSGDDETSTEASLPRGSPLSHISPHRSRRASRPQPRPIRTTSIPMSLPQTGLPSAPASPPTPAPSPRPGQKVPDWSTAGEHEDAHTRDIRALFLDLSDPEKERLLSELLNMCNSQQLSFVHQFVCPRLKKDPFTALPNELCFRVSHQHRQVAYWAVLILRCRY